nr:hypothetical protein [uncultured Carboxylicivirga sp.]
MRFILWTVCLLSIVSCQQNEVNINVFQNGIHYRIDNEIQRFKINSKSDTTIIGKRGTLIYIDSMSFKTKYGFEVKDSLLISVIEAVDINNIRALNLTTTSEHGIIESDGMLFINAQKEESQVYLKDQSKISILFPTSNRKADMTLWELDLNSKGNHWNELQSIDRNLTPVDLKLLEFYPSVNNVVFGCGYLTDSLIEAGWTESTALICGLILRDTVYYESGLKINQLEQEVIQFYEQSYYNEIYAIYNGIPSIYIEELYNENYRNTFIATKDFENRLNKIHKTCDEKVLKIYLENLDKNLWEADSLAAEYLKTKNSEYYKIFENFTKQKLLKVRTNKKIERIVNDAKNRFQQIYKVDSISKPEKFKNEVYYKFELSKLGWYNIDRYYKAETIEPVSLSVEIENLEIIDRISIYLSISEDKVNIPLAKSKDHSWTYFGKKDVKLPIGKMALVSGIAITDEGKFFVIEHEFEIKKENIITCKFKPISAEEVSKRFEVINTINSKVNDCNCKATYTLRISTTPNTLE